MSTTVRSWPTQLLIGWLNFALVAPSIFLYLGLPMIMRQHGWSGTEIGLFQLAGLPAIAKFLLATPIERRPPSASGYRSWSVLLGLGYVLSLLMLASQDVATASRGTLFALVFLASLMATWADIPLNALAIQQLPDEERLRAGAIRSAATSLGAIVGGGAMLLVHARHGWVTTFLTLASLLAVGLALLPLLQIRTPLPERCAMVPAGGRWRGYFADPTRRRWSLLVLLYFPCIGAAWVYLKPLLIDLGMPPQQIAMIVGIGGGSIAAAASLIGARVARRIGPARALTGFAVTNLLAIGLLWAVTALQVGLPATVLAIAAVAAAMGASSGLVFGLMMSFTRPGLAALDYGIQSSLFALSRTVVPLLAGILLDRGGHAGMLGGLAVGLVLAWWLARRHGTRVGAVV